MKALAVIVVPAALSMHLIGCGDNPSSSSALENLRLSFIDGSISANLMPVVAPDPISCQLTIAAQNLSETRSLNGVEIEQGEVFLMSSGVKLGTILFLTTWDGNLAPGERDTLVLVKTMADTTLFAPPCNQRVSIDIVAWSGTAQSETFRIDSLLFECTY